MSLNFPNTPAVDDVFPNPPQAGRAAWRWDGRKWQLFASAQSSGIGEAPIDGSMYGRIDGDWEKVEDVITPGIPDSNHDGVLYGRKDGAWVDVDDAIDTAVTAAIDAIPPPAKEPVGIAIVIPGKPPANQIYFIPIVFAFTIAASTTESKGVAAHAASAPYTMQLYKHPGGIPIGSVTFATDNTVTVTTIDVAFAHGDILHLQAPATQDATLADVGVTILGQRT